MTNPCGIDELRKSGGDLIDRVRLSGERLVVTKNGKAAVALVPMEDLKILQWRDESKGIKPFWLCIKDNDKKFFTFAGPMRDDRPWMAAIDEAQRKGRHITCATVKNGPSEDATNTFIKRGFTYAKIIINPPY